VKEVAGILALRPAGSKFIGHKTFDPPLPA